MRIIEVDTIRNIWGIMRINSSVDNKKYMEHNVNNSSLDHKKYTEPKAHNSSVDNKKYTKHNVIIQVKYTGHNAQNASAYNKKVTGHSFKHIQYKIHGEECA